jgi:hypothetical protein
MFILLIIGLALLYYIANNASGINGPPKDCKPHKWVQRLNTEDDRGYLICSVCAKIPGED